MQILKSKDQRIPYSEYVDTRPNLPTYNLDTISNKERMLSIMPTTFTDESGRTASEQFEESLKKQLDDLIGSFSPHFVPEEFANTVIKQDNLIAWNREALDILIHADYPQLFNRFKRQLEAKLLAWAKVDTSILDRQGWNDHVKKASSEFIFQLIKNNQKG